jgi:hypothetical protein
MRLVSVANRTTADGRRFTQILWIHRLRFKPRHYQEVTTGPRHNPFLLTGPRTSVLCHPNPLFEHSLSDEAQALYCRPLK